MKVKYPVVYVTKDTLKRTGINLSNFPNAGPNPNVAGMRLKFWGDDAALVKHGSYVYKVNLATYFKLGGLRS